MRRKQLNFAPKTSANTGLDYPDVTLAHAEGHRQKALKEVRALNRGPHCQLPGWVKAGYSHITFHLGMNCGLGGEPVLPDIIGLPEALLYITELNIADYTGVVLNVIMNPRGTLFHCFYWVKDGRKFLIVYLY